MKKAIHYIVSYLGSFLFFSGIAGVVLKRSILIVVPDSYTIKVQAVIAIIAFSIGMFVTLRCYAPNKYQ